MNFLSLFAPVSNESFRNQIAIEKGKVHRQAIWGTIHNNIHASNNAKVQNWEDKFSLNNASV